MSNTFSYEDAMTPVQEPAPAPTLVTTPAAVLGPAPAVPPAAALAPTPISTTNQGRSFSYDEAMTPLATPVSTPESPKPDRTLLGEAGHQLGLTGRAAVQGAAALPGMVSDAITGPINAGLDKVAGEGNGFRFQRVSSALGNMMDQAGVAQPETRGERIVQDAATGAAAAMTGVGAGQAVAQAAAGPITKALGSMMAAGPTMQAVSGATSGAAAGATREAGGGAIAQGVAGLAGALVPAAASTPFRSVVNPARSQTATAAQQAHDAGYVIPLADLSDGPVSSLLSGAGGKVKTSQEASFRNQTKSNDMARKALGMGADDVLDADALNAIRRDAAQAYAPVAGAGTVTTSSKYTTALDDAVKVFTGQAKSFPGRKPPAVVADIDSLKTGAFDAGDGLNTIQVLRNDADAAFRSGDKLSGGAYKAAAKALEGAIEDHLVGLGAPAADMLKQYRSARELIAKTYTVQGALNEATGSVNAIKLANDLKKNKPLTGELKTIAMAAQAFPKAMQSLKEAPGKVSVLDVVGGLAAAATSGNVSALGALAGRPLLRSAALSRVAQAQYVKNAGKSTAQGLPDGAAASLVSAAGRADNGASDGRSGKVFTNRLQAGVAARQSGGSVVPVEGGFVVWPKR